MRSGAFIGADEGRQKCGIAAVLPDLPGGPAPGRAQRPSICRSVVFVDEEGEHLPATVRAARGFLCDLTAFGGFGLRIENGVRYCADRSPMSWHWPDRT